MKVTVPVVFALLLVAVPFGAAQSPDPALPPAGGSDEATRTAQKITMYAHVFGNGLDAPMPANTYFPDGDNLFATWTDDNCGVLPVDDPSGQVAPGGADCDKNTINKLVVFLTAGPVQVHDARQFNYTKLHNEHGRAKDVFLDTTQDIHAWWYAAADSFSWQLVCQNGNGLPADLGCPYPQWGWDPGVLPNFIVEAKLYMAQLGDYGQGASEPPPIGASIAQAKVVAEGKTDPITLQTGLPGQPHAQEFDINLGKAKVDVIPKDQDLFIVYQWYEDLGGKKDLSMSPAPSMKPWAGELYPVRFTMPVRNPVDVELVIPQFLHGKALIAGVLSSPWGSYDVNVKSVTLDLRDPLNAPVPAEHMVRVGDYSVAHGAHFKPVNLTWIWDYQADHAKPGQYKATVHGCDLEGYCADTTALFTINPDGSPGAYTIGRGGQVTIGTGQLAQLAGNGGGNLSVASEPRSVQAPKATPGPEPLLAFAALAVAVLALRRRA